MSNIDEEIRAAQAERKAEQAEDNGIGLGRVGVFDSDIYGGASKPEKGTMLPMSDDEDDGPTSRGNHPSTVAARKAKTASGPPRFPDDDLGRDVDPMAEYRKTRGSGLTNTRIGDRHAKDSYKAQAMARRSQEGLSPTRGDAFGDQTPARTYADVMRERQTADDEAALRKAVQEQAAARRAAGETGGGKRARPTESGTAAAADQPPAAKLPRSRWDQTPVASGAGVAAQRRPASAAAAAAAAAADALTKKAAAVAEAGKIADAAEAASGRKSRWDQTPAAATPAAGASSRWDQTPGATPAANGSRWGQTPSATPAAGGSSRWGQTPGATPMVGMGATPLATPGATPIGGAVGGMEATPMGLTPGAMRRLRMERDMMNRNRPLSDGDLDAMFPMPGYVVLEPPAGYAPALSRARLAATPTPMAATPGFSFQETPVHGVVDLQPEVVDASLPALKPEDARFFAKLTEDVDEEALPLEEMKERKILKLLLRIKNGAPPMRKSAMRQITEKAREFGADALFNLILPMLRSGDALEDQERHLLVKVVDRVLYRLGDLVRPFVHKILVVVEPLLIEEDYYARVEGREIISNLAKAAGLATMISTMRPDIDSADEYMRNMTARAFAVVASALGVPALLPFLRAACQSRKSWEARHTGVRIVRRVAMLMGCSILPHLQSLVDCVAKCLEDEHQKVRTMTALALAALAEAAFPYGAESFDGVLATLWKATRQHRGKGLAALLKACGFIIPLMAADSAGWYVRELMPVVIREFQSPDEEVKRIVLKVVEQCIMNDGVDVDYVRGEILGPFFKQFWVRRMAADRENAKQLVLTTEQIANKVGSLDILSRIVDDLKDDAEPYRRMVMETVERVILNLGTGSVDENLEKRLMDGVLFAFQEQTGDDTTVMLSGFGTVVNALGLRVQPLLPQIIPMIQWRLNNKAPKIRMQAADLVGKIAPVMQRCGEEAMLSQLGLMMYEFLGEEFPEVLGSVLGGLKAIVNVIGMEAMKPPISELLPRLTPILRNHNEKVQQNVIDLVGRIADRGPEHVPPREWMRICFELLELLKAQRKSIRRATVTTFGYIAKAINPQDVIHTLLNNLRVQERQSRVCTTVAIAVVAETCFPFTVIPHLMNEYRARDMNVQNGVLKATSFMFEYIGDVGRDYIYAVVPMLEDALVERDRVHRQTACSVVKHLGCGVTGMGCEDAFQHLLNFVWPNLFESSPHVAQAVMEAIEGLRVALGPTKILQYALQGLFHPKRTVREKYWNVYNNLYVYTADAMTPALPRIEDDEHNTYTRHYLDMTL